MTIRHLILVAALSGVSLSSLAQEIVGPNGEEPDVTIRDEGDKRIEEYRVNGILYTVKVTPKDGTPYYLVRSQDDGNFVRADQPQQLRIPSWKIFTW